MREQSRSLVPLPQSDQRVGFRQKSRRGSVDGGYQKSSARGERHVREVRAERRGPDGSSDSFWSREEHAWFDDASDNQGFRGWWDDQRTDLLLPPHSSADPPIEAEYRELHGRTDVAQLPSPREDVDNKSAKQSFLPGCILIGFLGLAAAAGGVFILGQTKDGDTNAPRRSSPNTGQAQPIRPTKEECVIFQQAGGLPPREVCGKNNIAAVQKLIGKK